MVTDRQYIKIEKNQNHWKLRLNNRSKGNCYNLLMINQLIGFFSSALAEKKISFVTIEAGGKNFCTGADLDWMKSSKKLSEKENLEEMLRLAELYKTLEKFNKPIIAKAQGKTLGGGLGLLACFDVVVVGVDSKFGLPEVKSGLIPGIITPIIIRECGIQNYEKWSNTGELFGAEEALKLGIVNTIKPEEELNSYFQELVEKMHNANTVDILKLKKNKKYEITNSDFELHAKYSAEKRQSL